MFGIGTQELILLFLIVLLLFGANRIPEIGRALGKGIRDFKRATRDIEEDLDVKGDRSRTRLSEPGRETPPGPDKTGT
jgi:sec-independent protein translocase protein TatA